MRRLFRRRRWISLGTAALLAAGAVLAGATWLGLGDLPSVAAVMDSGLPGDTLLFDRTGTVLLADVQQPGVQHTDVPLAAMGRWLPAATVAVDDPGFWQEPGVDAGRLARAAWDGARGQPGGETGSSIVLRLIRLRVGTSGAADRVRAVALAVRVAAAVPKARILESYLNSLTYGNGAVGVEAAAIAYFQVDAAQLDLAQASLLAGLPVAPGRLNPLRDLPAAKARQRQVLDAMVRNHAITRRQADDALAEPLHLVGPTTLDVAPVFIAQVVAELRREYGDAGLRRGLTVLTTLDWGLQQQAVRTIQQALDDNHGRRTTAGALVALDPRSGQVLAMASTSPNNRDFDYAATIPRSPGNASRLFTYAAAIAGKRYTMVTPVDDAPIVVSQGSGSPSYRPLDYENVYHGLCELRACLGTGLNIPAVRVEESIGVPEVVRAARALGAPPFQPHFEPSGMLGEFTTDDPPESFGPSLTLGGHPETTLQMATAMSTLAAGGVLRQTETLLRVTAPDGGVIYRARADGAGRPSFDPGAAFVLTQALADGLDPALAVPGHRVAALAGTSEVYSDASAAGCTPSLAAAAWFGNSNYDLMVPGTTGTMLAAPAWRRFIQAALDQLGRGDEWFTPPPGLVSATVNGRTAWFLPGTSAATQPPPLPAEVRSGG